MLVGLLGFAALYVWPLTPRKLFFRDMQRIEVGMTRWEVEQLAGQWSRTPTGESLIGWPVGPDVEHWFHGQGGQLLSSDERVVSLEFVYD